LAFILVLILIVTACSKDDSVQQLSDKSTAERIQAAMSKLRNTLLDSEFGWFISYRPAEETGYFRFLFKFKEDGTVETWSNLDEGILGDDAGRSSVSEFEIMQGSTTKLSFTTEGLIHRLSDSGFSPIPGRENGGSGLKGDFEFLYFGESANGDTLTFRANRTQPDKTTQNVVRFIRAGSESESSLSVDPYYSIRESFVYKELTYGPGNELVVKADFHLRTRVLTTRRFIEETETFEDEYVAAMDYLPGNRIRLDSLRLSENELFKDVILQYDPLTGFFKSTEINGKSDGSRISVKTRNTPFTFSTDYLSVIDRDETSDLYFGYRDEDIGDLTTPAFNAIFADYADYGVTYFRLYTLTDVAEEYLWISEGAVGNTTLRQQLEFRVDSDRNRLIFINKGLVNGEPIDPSGQPFLDLLTDSEGFYVENLGRYTQFSNDVYTLTSVRNPAIRIGFYHVDP